MSKQIILQGLTPEEHNQVIFDHIDKRFNELQKHYEPKSQPEFITRHEVADRLKICLTTVHNMTKKGVLIKYQILGKVLYRLDEVLGSLTKIKH